MFRARKNSLGLRALFLFVVPITISAPTAYAVGLHSFAASRLIRCTGVSRTPLLRSK